MSGTNLIPQEAVVHLYRRYLRATAKIPNTSIRLLLAQQIRNNFRKNRWIVSATVQRELIEQAHKDLSILEDERHSKTLYINSNGLVSCIEWEMRRTEWHFNEKAKWFYELFLLCGIGFFFYLAAKVRHVESSHTDIAKAVDSMALKLEAENPEALQRKRQNEARAMVSAKQRQRELEHRILSTFVDVPKENVPLPTLANPTGTMRPVQPRTQTQQ